MEMTNGVVPTGSPSAVLLQTTLATVFSPSLDELPDLPDLQDWFIMFPVMFILIGVTTCLAIYFTVATPTFYDEDYLERRTKDLAQKTYKVYSVLKDDGGDESMTDCTGANCRSPADSSFRKHDNDSSVPEVSKFGTTLHNRRRPGTPALHLRAHGNSYAADIMRLSRGKDDREEEFHWPSPRQPVSMKLSRAIQRGRYKVGEKVRDMAERVVDSMTVWTSDEGAEGELLLPVKDDERAMEFDD